MRQLYVMDASEAPSPASRWGRLPNQRSGSPGTRCFTSNQHRVGLIPRGAVSLRCRRVGIVVDLGRHLNPDRRRRTMFGGNVLASPEWFATNSTLSFNPTVCLHETSTMIGGILVGSAVGANSIVLRERPENISSALANSLLSDGSCRHLRSAHHGGVHGRRCAYARDLEPLNGAGSARESNRRLILHLLPEAAGDAPKHGGRVLGLMNCTARFSHPGSTKRFNLLSADRWIRRHALPRNLQSLVAQLRAIAPPSTVLTQQQFLVILHDVFEGDTQSRCGIGHTGANLSIDTYWD